MQILGLKNCDTCRNALKTLQAAGHDVTLRDVRSAPLSRAELDGIFAALGDGVLNRRSTTWRGLDDAARARDPVQLILEHPSLMKRPVIIRGTGKMHMGWTAAVRSALNIA